MIVIIEKKPAGRCPRVAVKINRRQQLLAKRSRGSGEEISSRGVVNYITVYTTKSASNAISGKPAMCTYIPIYCVLCARYVRDGRGGGLIRINEV